MLWEISLPLGLLYRRKWLQEQFQRWRKRVETFRDTWQPVDYTKLQDWSECLATAVENLLHCTLKKKKKRPCFFFLSLQNMFNEYFLGIKEGMCYQISDLEHERSHLIRSQPFSRSKFHFLKDDSLEFSLCNTFQKKKIGSPHKTHNWKTKLQKMRWFFQRTMIYL